MQYLVKDVASEPSNGVEVAEMDGCSWGVLSEGLECLPLSIVNIGILGPIINILTLGSLSPRTHLQLEIPCEEVDANRGA